MEKTKTPLVSVIVPVYNSENDLSRCLDSLLSQTLKDIEIVIVDDGSTDLSVHIEKEYAEKDERIHIHYNEHRGVGYAKRFALDHAHGQFVTFVDSDDWVEKNNCQRLYESIVDTESDLVSSGIFYEYGSNNCQLGIDRFEEGMHDDVEHSIIPTMLYDPQYQTRGLQCYLVTKIFKKDLLSEIYKCGDPDISIGDDVAIVYPYVLRCKRIMILHDATYHYTVHDNSLCRTIGSETQLNTIRLYKALKNQFENHRLSNNLIWQLEKYIVQHELHILFQLFGIDYIEDDRYNFAEYQKYYDNKIVIYGAGQFGRYVVEDVMCHNRGGNIVAWIDKNAEKLSNKNYSIINLDGLLNLEYDTILVAIKRERMAEEAIDELINMYSIDEKKIVRVYA